MMSDQQIASYLINLERQNIKDKIYDNMDMKRQIKTFKCKEVMAFMKANPAILNQFLQINQVNDSLLDQHIGAQNVHQNIHAHHQTP